MQVNSNESNMKVKEFNYQLGLTADSSRCASTLHKLLQRQLKNIRL